MPISKKSSEVISSGPFLFEPCFASFAFEQREAETFALGEVGFGTSTRQGPDTPDVPLPFGDRDRASGVQKIKKVAAFNTVIVGRHHEGRFEG